MIVASRNCNPKITKCDTKLDTMVTCVACHTQIFGQGSGRRWRARIRAHELFPPLSFTAVGGRGRECDLRDCVFYGGWRAGRECDLRDSALPIRCRSRIRVQRLSAADRESASKDSALPIANPSPKTQRCRWNIFWANPSPKTFHGRWANPSSGTFRRRSQSECRHFSGDISGSS